jgi:hypothetical protein
MRIRPSFPKNVMNQPYFKGIMTGLLIGFGACGLVLSIIFNNLFNMIMSMAIFFIGSYRYLTEIKKDYNFIERFK